QSGATQPVLGICLSGGGSRALSCALGQLSALNAMTLPNGQPVLSSEQYISSVSGGTWASVLYTFLPTTISDTDFLIEPVAPQSLTKGGANTPGNVLYMGPSCMGTTPQQFSLANIGVFLKALMEAGFFESPSQYSWFWIAGVGELVLKPFGLYSATYNIGGPFVQPGLMFSLSTEEVSQCITKYNPHLLPADFYLARDGRPSLIVNTNLLENYQVASSPQIPVQATPVATSVLGKSPDGTVVGGGGVESFGFTSTLIGPGLMSGTASISTNRNYSLCDIAGCSSAFFAALMLQYIDKGVQYIVNDLEEYLVNDLHWSQAAADFVGGLLAAALESFTNDASDVIPTYNYWPAGQVNNPSNKTFGFSDGGSFDNTGVLGLLAQTNANKVIAFLNTETPLSGAPPNLGMDTEVGLLFGYGGAGPGDLTSVQVFDDTNPLYPGGAFAAVQTGLYNASRAGTTTLGTATAAFLQQGLVTIANPVANIAAGRVVDVLWVYNNQVRNWETAITDSGIQQDLAQRSSVGSTLWNFPGYSTVEQIYLSVEAVNMLAQLSAWNVQQLSGTIAAWLKP
ncbi:MAG TPA: hypothetical protein VFB82_02460, partial [Blastocatellia bacterium]|nr:hypothetical protein [Blastocatellia bacterium]